MSWADTSNKVKGGKNAKKSARGNRWDVDEQKAGRIYGQFQQFTRPRSSWAYLDEMPQEELGEIVDGMDWWERNAIQREKNRRAEDERISGMVARLEASRVMVQTFVDALSGEQSDYTVSIDPRAITAETDLHNRVMRLPARSILDPELSDQEAALLMVAFLGHEIGHVRLDDSLDKQMKADTSIIEKGLYNSLSTILREAHVEAGFSALFPGYSGLFEPMLRWISRDQKDGSTPPKNAIDFSIAATRYPFRFDWSDPAHEAERVWWTEWVAKYATVEDYPGHKAALDLAYEHIKAALQGKQDNPQDDESDDADQAEGGSQSGMGDQAGDPGDMLDGIPGGGESDQAGEPGQAGGQGEAGSDQGESDQGGASQSKSSSKTSGKGGSGASLEHGAPYETLANEDNKTDFQLGSEKRAIDSEMQQKVREAWERKNNGEITPDEYYDEQDRLAKKAKAAKAALTRNRNKAKSAKSSIPASPEEIEAPDFPGKTKREKAEAAADLQKATFKTNEKAGFTRDGDVIKPAGLVEDPTRRAPGFAQGSEEASGIMRALFMRMRGGNQGRVGSKRSGRLDDRHVYRLADRKDDRVFTRRGAAKTQPLRVYLMVDISGSMGGEPVKQVRDVSKALIEASIGADNLTLEVYGWHDYVIPVWKRGQSPDDVMLLSTTGGTNDVGSLRFAIERMAREKRTEEHGLIIMMSDGMGHGVEQMKVQVEAARRMGMSVYGISMDKHLNQAPIYGERGFVEWQGSVAATALPLAEIIQQSWLAKDQHRASR